MKKYVRNSILIALILLNNVFGEENIIKQFFIRPEIGYDSNIYENTQGIKSRDISPSLWYGGKLQKNINEIILRGQLIGYYSKYLQFSQENKGFNNFKMNIRYNLNNKMFIYSQYNYFGKYWPNSLSGYFHNTFSMGIGKSFRRITSIFDVYYMNSEYSLYNYFNNTKYGINLSNYFVFNPKFNFHVIVHSSNIYFDQMYNQKNRKDRIITSKFGIEYNNNIIIGTDLQISNVASNIDYNSNTLLYISPYLSAEMYNFYVQLLIRFTIKKYSTSLSLPEINNAAISPDPEENIYNRFFFKIEYPFTPKLSAVGKIAMIQNEYRYINRYYEKLLLGFGVQYNIK